MLLIHFFFYKPIVEILIKYMTNECIYVSVNHLKRAPRSTRSEKVICRGRFAPKTDMTENKKNKNKTDGEGVRHRRVLPRSATGLEGEEVQFSSTRSPGL